ncbi:hypothetical protein [Pseudoalteromonas sp. TAB23]|uniref:hypothetical protein n=1 Tax=Pseudoalteromonas sp. TAB23 TaxID=1938595 RepID=UPI000465CFEF|nr:hypothetical protein [Pseudoalteromonas sp. TAB23]
MPSIKFTVVAERLFVDDELSMDGLQLLAALVSNSEMGLISKRHAVLISTECNLHKEQIDDALEELLELGYIQYCSNTVRESHKRTWVVKP